MMKKKIVIRYRILIHLYVLVVLVVSMPVQAERAVLSAEEKKMFSLENNYVQMLYFAARNCPTDDQYEEEVRKLLQDAKCPRNALDEAHTLAVNIKDTQASLRIGDTLKAKKNPWTHSGRKAQGSLAFGLLWALAGASAWDMYGNDCKEVCRQIPNIVTKKSIDIFIELLKRLFA